jgi:hypothetical protein
LGAAAGADDKNGGNGDERGRAGVNAQVMKHLSGTIYRVTPCAARWRQIAIHSGWW